MVTPAEYGAQELARWTGKPITGAEYAKATGGWGTIPRDLPPSAFAWLESLMELGEWYVPGAGTQTAQEWVAFLSTKQGVEWWGALSPKGKSTLQPDYTIGGAPGIMGAAQYGSTPDRPVLALPWLRGKKESMLPSAKHPYGIPPGGGGAGVAAQRREYPFLGVAGKPKTPLEQEEAETRVRGVYRPGREIPPMRVPSARWLLF